MYRSLNRFDRLGRDAGDDDIVRHIFSDDRTGGDDDVVSDSYPRIDHNTAADPNVISDRHRLAEFQT